MNGTYCCGSASGFTGKNHPTGMIHPYRVSLSGVYSANGTRLDYGGHLRGHLVPYPPFRVNESRNDCFCRAVL